MSSSMLLGLFDWVGDFFKSLFDIFPKVMYLLYASVACVLDVLQLFFRKLAGLDVYYVDGKAVSGDLITNFITGILGINSDNLAYSALSTVFWSMVVFGIIICFASTLIAIIKSHYSYDDKAAKGPMQFVYTGGKAILNIVAVPIIIVLGLYVSQALLTALDSITSYNMGSIESMFGSQTDMLQSIDTVKGATGLEKGGKTYIRYDIFGFDSEIRYGTNEDLTWLYNDAKEHAKVGSTNMTFSGSLFKVAAYNANRARSGTLGNNQGAYADGSNLFANANGDNNKLAEMIDTAFACNLLLKEKHVLDRSAWGGWESVQYFSTYYTSTVASYSKFNVGLVWYYYDLWNFNFLVGFGAVIVCLTVFLNIIFGLMTRVLLCMALFLVAPPLFGLAPLDGGKAGKSWKENFVKQILMAYGAVVGMNLALMILPYFNEIDFFNIPIADYFAQTLFIIVGLITVKALIATASGLVGGADANETGGKIAEEVASTTGKAALATVGAGVATGKMLKGAGNFVMGIGHGAVGITQRFGAIKNETQTNMHKKGAKAAQDMQSKLTQSDLNGLRSDMSDRQIEKQLRSDGGLSKAEAREVRKAYRADIEAGGSGRNLNAVKGQLRSQRSEHTRAALDARKRMIKWDAAADARVNRMTGRLKKGSTLAFKGGLVGFGTTAYKNVFSTNKAVKTFKETIIKPPDWAEEAGKAGRAQAAMQEWQMTHPGQVPTEKQLESLRKGEQPEE